MYGYRQANDNSLATNLNSISSSISSIDTIGRRATTKASADNLIHPRNQSTASTSLLWRANKDERYSTTSSIKNGPRTVGSEIYFSGDKTLARSCLNPEAAFDLILVPFLILTIIRQVLDFLGQIWLQILVNFFTIIIIIVALFGVRQRRISYLDLFSSWAFFNAIWNLIIFCIYIKFKDVGLTEETLSLYTGSTSWWQSNGPGCLPYNISSIKPPVGILQPSIITGCRLDYHLIESSQAVLHASLSLLSSMISCCVRARVRRDPARKTSNDTRGDKIYRMNNLVTERARVSSDPYPVHKSSRFGSNTASLRRAPNKSGSRSSQHSVSSDRQLHRRTRLSVDGTLPTPRGSTSSAQRSQKYGSLSSRRSNRRDRRSDVSSMTYGVTGEKVAPRQRTRLSSLSSADYLPSYQPPHSSSANLLSSYGEISSIDSYSNQTTNPKRRQTSIKSAPKGNTNPTFDGSRSSVYSQAVNTHNYDDLSYIYGNNNDKNSENRYSARHSGEANKINQNLNNQQSKIYAMRINEQQQTTPEMRAEPQFQLPNLSDQTSSKIGPTSNGTFQSFSASRSQQAESNRLYDTNNRSSKRNYTNGSEQAGGQQIAKSNDFRSRPLNNPSNQLSFSNGDRSSRYPIYSNQMSNGNINSETPI